MDRQDSELHRKVLPPFPRQKMPWASAIVAAGALTVSAILPASGASATTSKVVLAAAGPTSQTITFEALANKTLAQSPVTVGANSSSGLAVNFTTTTPSVCTSGGTDGATIALAKPGTCTVQAAQAGDATYNPAPPFSQSFKVSRGPPDDQLWGVGRRDPGPVAGGGRRQCLVGAGCELHYDSALGVHLGWHRRGDYRLGHARDLHCPGDPSWRRHLQSGGAAQPELQGVSGLPDDQLSGRWPTRPWPSHRWRWAPPPRRGWP